MWRYPGLNPLQHLEVFIATTFVVQENLMELLCIFDAGYFSASEQEIVPIPKC